MTDDDKHMVSLAEEMFRLETAVMTGGRSDLFVEMCDAAVEYRAALNKYLAIKDSE